MTGKTKFLVLTLLFLGAFLILVGGLVFYSETALALRACSQDGYCVDPPDTGGGSPGNPTTCSDSAINGTTNCGYVAPYTISASCTTVAANYPQGDKCKGTAIFPSGSFQSGKYTAEVFGGPGTATMYSPDDGSDASINGTTFASYYECTCGSQDKSGNNCAGTYSPVATNVNILEGATLTVNALNMCMGNGYGTWGVGGASAISQGTYCFTNAMDATPPHVGSYVPDSTGNCKFKPVQRTLTVTKKGTGSGTVTSAPGGINCGATCSTTFDQNITPTSVTLTATPAGGSAFAGWSGDCATNGTVTMDADRVCTATFNTVAAPPACTLGITYNGDTSTTIPYGGSLTVAYDGTNVNASTLQYSFDGNAYKALAPFPDSKVQSNLTNVGTHPIIIKADSNNGGPSCSANAQYTVLPQSSASTCQNLCSQQTAVTPPANASCSTSSACALSSGSAYPACNDGNYCTAWACNAGYTESGGTCVSTPVEACTVNNFSISPSSINPASSGGNIVNATWSFANGTNYQFQCGGSAWQALSQSGTNVPITASCSPSGLNNSCVYSCSIKADSAQAPGDSRYACSSTAGVTLTYPPPSPVCTGNIPTNAGMCNASTPSVGTSWTGVSSCSTAACQYSCNNGYYLNNGTCYQNLSCAADNGSVQVNTNNTVRASGGNSTYTWSGGETPASGSGSSFTTSFSTSGSKTIAVISAGASATCSFTVTDTPVSICTGAPPDSNSVSCSGPDPSGGNKVAVLAPNCSSPKVACEFSCKSGYEYSAGACVPTSVCNPGTVKVNSNVAATWIITGPGANINQTSAVMSATYSGQATGTYTISPDSVDGYTTASGGSLTLGCGGTVNDPITFNLSYTQTELSCSGSVPSGSSACFGTQETNLSSAKIWTSVSSCSSPSVCEYFSTPLPLDAVCSSITVPDSVAVGQDFNATVVMTNTGSNTWTTPGFNPYRLGTWDPQDNTKWLSPSWQPGANRVALPSGASIAPGEKATFNFTANTSYTPGVRKFYWKMVKEGVAWFGGICTKNITVTATSTCLGSPSQACVSAPNSCGQTNPGTQTRVCTAGTWVPWGSCSAVTPPESECPPVPTLSVTLSANPSSGQPPLTSTLTATVSGTAQGSINYKFWKDCNSTSTNLTYLSQPNVCGAPTAFDSSNENPKTTPFTYDAVGTYHPKVLVQRDNGVPNAQAITTITVGGQHSECVAVGQSNVCKKVDNTPGNTENRCDDDADCNGIFHSTCINSFGAGVCTNVSGAGTSTCDANSGPSGCNCVGSNCGHLSCQNASCVIVGGSGSNECASVGATCSSLSVSLSANPSSGTAPLTSTLTATVSGSAQGTINYKFWKNCNNPTIVFPNACGTPDKTYDTSSNNPQTHQFTYDPAGAYHPKVLVQRGSATNAEARTTVTASNIPLTRYSCSGAYCIQNAGGPYTTSNCNNACSDVGGLSCSGPASGTTGQSLTFTASNGTGGYTWSGGGTPPIGANASFNTSFSTTGNKNVVAKDSSGATNTCAVNISNGGHFECVNNACTSVANTLGNTADRCGNSADCVGPTHGVCDDTGHPGVFVCINVAGAGAPGTGCSIDPDCGGPPQSHLECQNTSCVVVGGAGSNECVSAGAVCSACTLTASPTLINPGGSTTLTWVCGNGVSGCSIDQGVGAINPPSGGSKSGIKPAKSTTYTLTCTKGGAPVTANASVKVFSIIECNPNDPTCKK